MAKSSILLVPLLWCPSSVHSTSDMQNLISGCTNDFPPIKHFPVSRYFSPNDANTSHVNEDKSDQTRRVRRDALGGGYDIRHMLDRFILSSIKRTSGDFPFALLMALSSRYGR